MTLQNLKQKILPRKFYECKPEILAPKLLGKYLIRNFEGNLIGGKIVEVEAYLGNKDEASHSFKGITKRTEVLFGEAGFTYVYSIHAQHCIDIVADSKGISGSVLIRALEPTFGIEFMKKFRNKENIKDLTTGPGKLCKALNITRAQNGVDVTSINSEIFIVDLDGEIAEENIHISKRIGISKAKEIELRFSLRSSEFVSRKLK